MTKFNARALKVRMRNGRSIQITDEPQRSTQWKKIAPFFISELAGDSCSLPSRSSCSIKFFKTKFFVVMAANEEKTFEVAGRRAADFRLRHGHHLPPRSDVFVFTANLQQLHANYEDSVSRNSYCFVV